MERKRLSAQVVPIRADMVPVAEPVLKRAKQMIPTRQEAQDLFAGYIPEALERLVYWMRSDDPKVSHAAATQILNRSLGMPVQATELSGPGGQSLLPPSLNISFVAAAAQASTVLDGKLEEEPAVLEDKREVGN